MGSPGWRGSSLIHSVGTCPGALKSGWILRGWLLVALGMRSLLITGCLQELEEFEALGSFSPEDKAVRGMGHSR